MGDRTAEHRHHPRRWMLISLALLVLGVACLAMGLQNRQHPLAGPAASPTPPHITLGNGSSRSIARSVPIALSIPAIGLADMALSELALNQDGTVQVPTDTQEAGWYRLGPAPGQLGSAVILGHVDSHEGPAVFFNLRSLVTGDVIDVTLADAVVARFTVKSVVMYDKSQFPSKLVYSPHGDAELQLVTCGGTFDPSTGSYLSNLVVFTSLSGVATGD